MCTNDTCVAQRTDVQKEKKKKEIKIMFVDPKKKKYIYKLFISTIRNRVRIPDRYICGGWIITFWPRQNVRESNRSDD